MKPRQTFKDFHNSNAPPYQHPNSSTPLTLGDIDLARLGLNLDDLPNLQAAIPNNLANQEDIVKYLHAIYSKNNSELLQKLPSLNDWPMQSVSPPDYSRAAGGGASGSNNNVIGGGCGTSFSSSGTINSSCKPGQQQTQQESQFINSQHQTPTINHHFRVSTSNVHSSQQQLSQPKSVLSLHQHHHQNDLSSRRFNQHMSTTNASFANLSTVNATNATSTSTSLPDTNNLSTLGGNILNKNSGATGVLPQVSNIMDTLGSMDSMFYDSSMQINKNNSNNHQQSLIKHQQLQKLLKATGSQPKSSSTASSTTLSHRNDPHSQRNITSNNMPQTQLPIPSPASTISPPQAAFTSVPKSLLNLAACSSSSPASSSSSSLPLTSKFSSMVSQLNLRTARNVNNSGQSNLNNNNNNSSSGNINSTTAINNNYISGNLSNSRTIRNTSSNINNNNNNNNNNVMDAFNQKGSNRNEISSVLKHMTRSTTALPPANQNGSSSKSGLAKQLQMSLLSDDQLTSRGSSRNACNANSNTSQRSHIPRHTSTTSREAFLADLQERAAKVGVSIGEINKPVQTTSTQSSSQVPINSVECNPLSQTTTVIVSPNQLGDDSTSIVDRKEIESALSRVEARNDLSLLYPPMLLASNSQQHINALSAGIQGAEESELFTKEVKKIVLEECNIIYECKECNNLFRSLANLVKHKRTYCVEKNSERNSIELNKRSYIGSILSQDQQQTTVNNGNNSVTFVGDSQQDSQVDVSQEHNLGQQADNSSIRLEDLEHKCSNEPYNTTKSDTFNVKQQLVYRLRKNQERKIHDLDGTKSKNPNNRPIVGNNSATTTQTSLSKLLQSKPKNRLPVSRDIALIGALNMASVSTTDIPTNYNSLSAFDSDKNMNPSDVTEQLVQNSSLAKTLLNEKVRGTNLRQLSELIELSKVESNQSRASTSTVRVAPKRKFLEDCIQKVKRDKLLTEGDDNHQPIASNAATTKSTIQHLGNKRPTLDNDNIKLNSPEDSDQDSDMLMIDLDEPKSSKSTTTTKKTTKSRRISANASSTASPSSSTKLNSSSALLKALTRPVDSKRPYTTITPVVNFDEKANHQSRRPEEGKAVDTADSEDVKMVDDENLSAELEVLSPLFDKYTCDICDVDYQDLLTLINHTVAKHTEEKIIYPCIFCSFSFITMENVCRHIIDIHKKPKAQVHRLSEVVRSRSYISTDFLACSDHPPVSYVAKVAEKVADSSMDEESFAVAQERPESSQKPNSLPKLEGVRTRGKKRVDYNQMINNDISGSDTRTRKSRSKSADQPNPTTDITQANETYEEKAVSVDGESMDSKSVTPRASIELSVSEKDDIDVCFDAQSDGQLNIVAFDEQKTDDGMLEDHHKSPSSDSSKQQTTDSSTLPPTEVESQEPSVDDDDDEYCDGQELMIDGDSPVRTSDDCETNNNDCEDDSNDNEANDELCSEPEINNSLEEEESENDVEEANVNQNADCGGEQVEQSDDESSSSSQTSSSSSSSGTGSSSSSTSSGSGSDSSSSSSEGSPSDDEEPSIERDGTTIAEGRKANPANPLRRDDIGDFESESENSSQASGGEAELSTTSNLSKQTPSSIKDQKIQQSGLDQRKSPHSSSNNDPDSEAYPDSEANDDHESSSLIPQTRDKQPLTASPGGQSTKSTTQSRPSSSSNKSTSESTTPSGSSSVGGGGIMKLKIQLKTRPDEKSKVYEIV